MSAKDPLFQRLLDALPSDDNCDENIPRELCLKKAGEKRYWYQGASETTQGTSLEGPELLEGPEQEEQGFG